MAPGATSRGASARIPPGAAAQAAQHKEEEGATGHGLSAMDDVLEGCVINALQSPLAGVPELCPASLKYSCFGTATRTNELLVRTPFDVCELPFCRECLSVQFAMLTHTRHAMVE
eukprot:1146321-Pelagomonas_calceolata.AAC.3